MLKPRHTLRLLAPAGQDPLLSKGWSSRAVRPVAIALLSILAASGMGSPAHAQDLGRLLIHGLQWLQVSQLNDAQEVSLGRQIDIQVKWGRVQGRSSSCRSKPKQQRPQSRCSPPCPAPIGIGDPCHRLC
jgi:hypothetical protein